MVVSVFVKDKAPQDIFNEWNKVADMTGTSLMIMRPCLVYTRDAHDRADHTARLEQQTEVVFVLQADYDETTNERFMELLRSWIPERDRDEKAAPMALLVLPDSAYSLLGLGISEEAGLIHCSGTSPDGLVDTTMGDMDELKQILAQIAASPVKES